MSRNLAGLQETERRRLARELHDEMGQALGALKLNLERMKARPTGADHGTFLEESIGIVDHLVQQARSLALDLRPSLLDDFGLVPALPWYVANHAHPPGLTP